MKKEKYLQIFSYLKEFSNLRSKPVRDIENQETQYPEKVWLDDIPEHERFENIIKPDFDKENEFWLKVSKPREPSKPEFATLPGKLERWIDKGTLFNEESQPQLKESMEVDDTTFMAEDDPELKDELQQYIDEEWIDDLIIYKEEDRLYQARYSEFQALNKVYKKLFRIFNKTQQLGEEYELVMGVGLLNFKKDDNSPKIFRHVLTQRVDIYFEYGQKDSHIYIQSNEESLPQLESDAILDLTEQFDSQNIIDAEKEVDKLLKLKNIDTLFSHSEDILQMYAERISPDGSFKDLLKKPQKVPAKPVITFSPALLLRKRNTKSFKALYEKILEKVENDTEGVEIPAIDDLIGAFTDTEPGHSYDDKPDSNTSKSPVFFPKEYNEEQLEIVEKSKIKNKVLVQGPPGTGKSHTIANLICHLLANGKKVLVTAYTKRALEVLKDKLPPEFQDLAVNLLSGDSSSIQDLQSSVNSINDELSRANLSTYQKDIEVFQKTLGKLREDIAKKYNELIAIKEKTTRKFKINNIYQGTLTEIAEQLEKDETTHAWYKDEFSDITHDSIISELSELIKLHNNYKGIDFSEFKYEIPDTEKLLTLDEIKHYKQVKETLEGEFNPVNEYINISCLNFEGLKNQLNALKSIYQKIDNIQIGFTPKIIESFLAGNTPVWLKRLGQSESILNRFAAYDIREIDKDVEVIYPKDKSLKQLKKDAQTLYSYIQQGNPLVGFVFALKKSFLPKEIKERLYFIEGVRVNGSPCDTIEEFDVVLRDISFQQDFIELSETWTKELPEENSLSKKLNYFHQIHSEVLKLLQHLDQVEIICRKIESDSNLEVKLFNRDDLEERIKEVEFNQLSESISSYKRKVGQCEAYLSQSDLHPIKAELLSALYEINPITYQELIKSLDTLISAKEGFKIFETLKTSLKSHVPFVVESIERSNFSSQDLSNLNGAILFKNAQHQLNKVLGKNYENLLLHLKELEKKERGVIAKLASKKAWYQVVNGLKHNRSLRQHLDAWMMAVKKIGKTGRGKKARKFKKIAQQEMEFCKDSIPCWIMPLYKVAETIHPEQEMYDYVIIDEASQLGPEAIFLLYISKNIIIVGDDKQTSPENVGVSSDIMIPHIKKYLQGIPYADFYGPEFSFFDHAKLFCDGVTVLREHFRCMPEIIEFSNRYFYAPDGKGLYPLKQYSENRLEPLVNVFCENGYTEGKYSKIINEPEANIIADTIGKLIDDNRYSDKTFGVITLQGNQQASLIENLLLKKIGEKEFHKRKIVCGNSSSFQGDERDIIFLSLVTAHNHNRSALVKSEDERRFNVAASRAKEQMWLFHSVQLDDLSNRNDLRYKLLNHFENYNAYQPILNTPIERKPGTQPDPFDSWFEVDVYNDIVNKQLSVIPQYEVAKGRYRIDLVMLLPDGTKIAIECDGDKWHGPEQYRNDIIRQKVLERCGWQFIRVRGYEYYSNRIKALEPLWGMLQKIDETTNINVDKTKVTEVKESKPREVEASQDLLINKPIFEPKVNAKQPLESTNRNTSSLNDNRILRYFNLYKSGVYILTEQEPLKADFVIPIKVNHSSGFLLQGYSSGHVNKVHISVLLSRRIGKEYMNGINQNGDLIFLEVIESEEIIGIFFKENKRRKFKAHLTENISSREQLQLQGYKVIYNDFESIKYVILPLEIQNKIGRLIFQSFTANGKPVDNNYYDPEWSIIKQYRNLKKKNKTQGDAETTDDQEHFTPITLFDNRIGLNSVVKIRFLNKDKVFTIKLVDYETKRTKSSEGVQEINIATPLAISIKGKTVGDRIKVINTNNVVEIVKIY